MLPKVKTTSVVKIDLPTLNISILQKIGLNILLEQQYVKSDGKTDIDTCVKISENIVVPLRKILVIEVADKFTEHEMEDIAYLKRLCDQYIVMGMFFEELNIKFDYLSSKLSSINSSIRDIYDKVIFNKESW